jgi:hypothetical protein
MLRHVCKKIKVQASKEFFFPLNVISNRLTAGVEKTLGRKQSYDNLNLWVMIQCFSLITKQHQLIYQPRKPSNEQGGATTPKHFGLSSCQQSDHSPTASTRQEVYSNETPWWWWVYLVSGRRHVARTLAHTCIWTNEFCWKPHNLLIPVSSFHVVP